MDEFTDSKRETTYCPASTRHMTRFAEPRRDLHARFTRWDDADGHHRADGDSDQDHRRTHGKLRNVGNAEFCFNNRIGLQLIDRINRC